MDDITLIIQTKIKEQYKSIRQFALETGIPYTTIKSAINNGFSGMAVETVIKICEKLGIDVSMFGKRKKPDTGEGDRRSELLEKINSIIDTMNVEQLNRYLSFIQYVYLPDEEFIRMTSILELAKIPLLKT